MIAVLQHELKSYFRSLTAYVFGAFLLVFVGIGAMMYNIQASVSNFEYVLGFCSIAFAVVVPILTMRVIAEERKQKTDQLLYALPVSTTQVVFGKYLSLLTVFLIPLVLISLYPLIFAQYGDVCLLTAYGSMLAFFIMGAALMAMGMFISSLTDNQGFAAGIGIAVILLDFFSLDLAEYASATALGSVIVLGVLTVVLGLVIRHMTKNDNLSFGVCVAGILGISITYFVDSTVFEGIVPDIMSALSLFARFDTFVSGVFDITGVIYYCSVIAFFLFLTVQSLEKRRYN